MTVPINNIMARRRESGIINTLLTNINSKTSNNNRTVDVQYVFNEVEKQKLLNKHGINKTKIISYSPVPEVIDIGDTLWTFDTPAPGTQVNNFIVTTGPAKSILYWGDDTSVTISPDTSTSLNHTY
jgi:hypothetical protein